MGCTGRDTIDTRLLQFVDMMIKSDGPMQHHSEYRNPSGELSREKIVASMKQAISHPWIYRCLIAGKWVPVNEEEKKYMDK